MAIKEKTGNSQKHELFFRSKKVKRLVCELRAIKIVVRAIEKKSGQVAIS